MKICFIPIDNRPVCYNLARDIAAIDNSIELLLPPREYLGDLTKPAKVKEILDWMEQLSKCDVMVLSLDTIAYGGLIPSRRTTEKTDEICARLARLKSLLANTKVYAFSSIMRISDNNCNEEEKEYWNDWGKKIFKYSYSGINEGIPQEILDDYIATRKRNFVINKMYLNWNLDTLIYSKDDCAPKGFNVDEAKELEFLGGKIKTGADEIPLALLARAIKKEIRVFVKYTEPEYKDCISNYEDISIEASVQGQLELSGFSVVKNETEADLILIVNNFIEKQGEHVMGWSTEKYKGQFTPPQKPYAVADVRFANGADNDFVEQLLPQIDLKNFYGYSGWNTSANSLGSLLAGIKVRWNAEKYNENAFKCLQIIRFLDDWAYQANIRINGKTPNIEKLMKPYEEKLTLTPTLSLAEGVHFSYSYPWNRSFEIEITIK